MYLKNKGFTLIELMVVVVIVAILAAIAIPSYQSYVRRTNESMAMQEMQQVAIWLERYKARNFSYKGASPPRTDTISIPTYSTNKLCAGGTYSGTFTIQLCGKKADGSFVALKSSDSIGQSWSMRSETTDPNNYTLLLTSSGLRCKNKASSNVTFESCGTGSENW
ncbi:prepilin-type N-terminal cleavage/methylation domain-containing protein [Acinetobacter nectaris]|nr:prepilin-type N-terminal cleavage/methylation domain-containing protein [Acinetobacter nectaris]MCF9045453.1 prepilin-type N-terminal cleavage/methylation domain-containing protein [Acinetobacter nectaris]